MSAGLSLDLLKIGAKPKVTVAKPVETAASPEAQISVTASAAQAIKEQLAKRETTTAKSGLRVGVKAGGCSGLSYIIQFEDDPRDDDKIVVKDDARVFCDPKSHAFLAHTELDYVRTLMKTGFEFRNPNQKSACGCGDSFQI